CAMKSAPVSLLAPCLEHVGPTCPPPEARDSDTFCFPPSRQSKPLIGSGESVVGWRNHGNPRNLFSVRQGAASPGRRCRPPGAVCQLREHAADPRPVRTVCAASSPTPAADGGEGLPL